MRRRLLGRLALGLSLVAGPLTASPTLSPAGTAEAAPVAVQDERGGRYLVGRGIADVTGPVADVQLMGYADTSQLGAGLQQRQWSRAFVVVDRRTGERVVHVTADLGLMFQSIRDGVLERLRAAHVGLYGERNVMLTVTHTHAGVGGQSHHALYDLPYGHQPQALGAAVDGIVASVERAHDDLAPSTLGLATTTLVDASANRSREAFRLNPRSDRRHFPGGIDPRSTTLTVRRGGALVGALNWFAVHATSLTTQNRLVSGDNKGYAAYAWERLGRGVDRRDIDPDLVTAFAQTNAGDMSPNLRLRPGTGPTTDEFRNAAVIGRRQQEAARSSSLGRTEPVTGGVDSRLVYVDLSDVRVSGRFTPDGEPGRTCPAALGAAFAAGSQEDGGGAPPGFTEGDGEGEFAVNPVVGLISDALYTASPELRACQAPKDVLAPVGPLDVVQQRLPVQLVRIGPLYLVGVPVEPTIVSGLRLRQAVARVVDAPLRHVLTQGYANAFAHYLTTPEEYDAQQYEGASTMFGRLELPALTQVADRLARSMRDGTRLPLGQKERDRSDEVVPPLTGQNLLDTAPPGTDLGDVVTQPRSSYTAGSTASAVFVGAHHNNDLRAGGTYLLVERRTGGRWVRVATDDDWTTRFGWSHTGPTSSEVTVGWDVAPSARPGRYRLRYLGDAKGPDGSLTPVRGTSRTFAVR
ncbi:neutral/alkaline ceramidase [Nocardioides sp. CFH 31398]|uniref:neutral/alkaline ceramidase n=1 Tax=Nocardioides sp. CFH 31398 TaxID=2919579 RepID=UPI001F05EDDF|nr:neutral/alkaline ceramidase [Nocardioides sp. CFH 31398]MCH1865877.1 neutral/alkaline ceramidase [Nocardioides sp. CFH 31398]